MESQRHKLDLDLGQVKDYFKFALERYSLDIESNKRFIKYLDFDWDRGVIKQGKQPTASDDDKKFVISAMLYGNEMSLLNDN